MIALTGFGFPRSYRLLNRSQFGRVFDGRCRVSDEYFTVYALANNSDHPRLGLVVGKKAARKAVDRNRIKRIVRESFRAQAAHFSKLDVVVLAKAAAATQPGSRLISQLTNLYGRVEAKCAKSPANFS